MNRGKVICKELKELRRKIAEENGIPLEIKECTYEGPCRGTCPRCEAEVRYLESSLANRLRMGKVAAVAGLALGLASCGGNGNDSGNTPTPQNNVPPAEPDSIEDADTVRHICDTTPPLWREPGDEEILLGVYVEPFEGELTDIFAPPPPEPWIDESNAVEGEIDDDVDIVMFPDTDPVFPGGNDAMIDFFQKNLEYPQLALENNITGKVYVSFVVETDGSITNPRILRDIGAGCGKEAVRVVKMMPKWTPGKKDGKAVRVQRNLPVVFSITEDMRVRVIEGMAPAETGQRPFDDSVETMKGPNAPTQQMKVDGVKVIVK